MNKDNKKKNNVFKKIVNKKSVLIVLFTFIICLFVSYWYVKYEDNVYVYDYIGYQLRANYLYQLMAINIMDGIKYLFETIRINDYNSLPVFFILPFYKVFGISRITYILSIVFLYMVPSILLFYWFVNETFEIKESKFKTIIYYICILLFSGFWSATLRGLPDISGIIPLILLLFIVKKYNFTDKLKIYVPIIFGLLAYLPFILRRWYAYGVVSLYFSYFLINLYYFIKSNKKKESFINATKNFIIAGSTTLALLLIFQLPLVNTIIHENYSNSYSAFQYTLSQHINSFLGEYGIYLLLLILLGIVSIFYSKENRRIKIYATLNIIIFVFLFTRTQGMGVHHFLGISIYSLLMALFGIDFVANLIKNKYAKITFLFIIAIIFVFNYVNTYCIKIEPNYILQKNRYFKFKYENYDNLLKMCNDMSTLINEKYGKISSFASSQIMSDSLIDNACGSIISNNLIYTSTVDLRDGYNYNSLLNKYVIVTDPVQADLAKDTQLVLTIPNSMILSNEGIGNSYKRVLGPYILSNGVKAYVYEKTTHLTEEGIDEYNSILFQKYPEWKNEYYLVEKLLLTSMTKLGKDNSEFKRLDEDSYFITPGIDPTTIEANFFDDLDSFKLKFYTKDIPNIDGAGVINLKITQKKKTIFDGEISLTTPAEIVFDKKNGKNIKIEVSNGELFSYDFLYFDILEINGKVISDEKK